MSECPSKNGLYHALPEPYAQPCDVVEHVASFFFVFPLDFGLSLPFRFQKFRCPHLYIPVLRPQPLDFIPSHATISLLLHPTMYITIAKSKVLVQLSGCAGLRRNTGVITKSMLHDRQHNCPIPTAIAVRTEWKEQSLSSTNTMPFIYPSRRRGITCYTRCRLCTSSWHR